MSLRGIFGIPTIVDIQNIFFATQEAKAGRHKAQLAFLPAATLLINAYVN